MIPLGGHSRGHIGVAVDTGKSGGPRWLLHAGDAYDDHRKLSANPQCGPVLRVMERVEATDMRLFSANIARLAELSNNPDVAIVSAHDLVEFERAQQATMVG